MRAPFVVVLVAITAIASVFIPARSAVADPGIGSDAAFPIGGVAANTVLEPVAGAPVLGPLVPPPATRITSLIAPPNPPAFGETEDISYADEMVFAGPLYVEFSVGVTAGGAMSTGHPGTPPVGPPAFTLANESGIAAPPGDGATMSDIYRSIPLAGPPPCGIFPDFQILDDDGAGPIAPRLGLNMPPGPGVGPGASNIDAYDRSEETPGIRPLPATGGPPVAATGIIFFTIDGATAAAWGGGVIPAPGGGAAIPGPGDIMAWNPAIGGPVIYATAGALGLLPGPGGDNVDALAITRLGAAPPLPPFGPGFDFEPAGTATIVFSLGPGSPSLSPTSGGAAATPLAPACFAPGTGTAGDLWFVAGPVPLGGAGAYLAAEQLGLNSVRTGGGADDNLDAVDMCSGFMGSDIDGDGTDDACDFDKDGDGMGDFIDPDDDGDGFGDPQSTTHEGPANTVVGTDNCPMVPNPSQANSDGNFVDMSPPLGIDDKTWPNSDYFGDACDSDDDNDGLSDTTESAGPPCASASGPTNPLVRDTDGDNSLDGAECAAGTDPVSYLSRPPVASCGALGDADGDGLSNRVETCGYNSSNGSANTDSDTCGDAREVASVNGDMTINAADLGLVASNFGTYSGSPPYSIAPPYPPQKVVFDVNKDGTINAADLGFVASKFGACP